VSAAASGQGERAVRVGGKGMAGGGGQRGWGAVSLMEMAARGGCMRGERGGGAGGEAASRARASGAGDSAYGEGGGSEGGEGSGGGEGAGVVGWVLGVRVRLELLKGGSWEGHLSCVDGLGASAGAARRASESARAASTKERRRLTPSTGPVASRLPPTCAAGAALAISRVLTGG
jgi:hypothetical protein